jgi:glycosyltransferase 2 family protein
MKKNFLIGILISVFFIYLIVRQLDFNGLLLAMKSANYIYLFPLVLVFPSNLLIRAIRWRYLVNPLKERVGILSLFSATSIGFMVNMLLPGRIGEFVRAIVLGYKEKISKTASFATIVVERLIDGFSILAILALILPFVTFPEESGVIGKYLKTAVYLSFLFYLIVLVFLIFLKKDRLRVISWIQVMLFFLPHRMKDRIVQVMDSFASGLKVLENGTHIIPIVIISFAVWLSVALINFMVFKSFYLTLPLYAPVFLVVIQAVGAMFPSPGFIGPFHYASIQGMIFFSVSKEVAAGAALIMHASFFFPAIVLGFIFLWKENLSFSEIKKVKKEGLSGD